MTTLEQKEKNRKYILDRLDEYVVDVKGNFFNTNPEMLGENENSSYCYVGKESLTPEGVEEIKNKMGKNILKNVNDWELVFDNVNNLTHFRNKKTGVEISKRGWQQEVKDEIYYKVIGELNYRENIWKNYEEVIKQMEIDKKKWEEWEKWWQENIVNNTQFTSPRSEKKNQWSQNPISQTPNQSNQIPEPLNNQNKNNSLPDKENNPLLPPTDIRPHYNFDKTKSEINNNPNLTNNKEKQKTEELLKTIIIAESLTQKKQFNQEILTKLLNEKKQNNSIYQTLNKEKSIDKAISQLESIEKSQKSNNNSVAGKKDGKNSFPVKVILVPLGLMIVGLGIIVLIKRRKSCPKKSRPR